MLKLADSALMGLNWVAVWVWTRCARTTETDFYNCVQTTIYFYAAQTFATNGSVYPLGALRLPVNPGPKSTMWLYPIDGAVQLRIAASIGTHL